MHLVSRIATMYVLFHSKLLDEPRPQEDPPTHVDVYVLISPYILADRVIKNRARLLYTTMKITFCTTFVLLASGIIPSSALTYQVMLTSTPRQNACAMCAATTCMFVC